MSTTSPTEFTAPAAREPGHRAGRSLWRPGVAASVAASAVVFAGAALAEALGVTFTDRTGGAIPLAGFAPVTVLLSLLGVVLALVLARRVRHPRPVFVRVTVTLLALSLIPVWANGFGTESGLALTGLHLTAGAIVIPALRSRLASTR